MQEGLNRRNVALAIAAAFIGNFAFRLSVPVVAFYSRLVLEASATLVGALMAVFFAARASMAVIAGRSYYSRRSLALAVLCFIVTAASMILYAFVDSIAAVLALRFLQGAMLGYAWTIVQVIVGSSAPPRIRGTIYALYFGIGAVAFPIANAVYAALAYQPIIVPLTISAILFLAVASIVALLERVEPPKPKGARGGGGALAVILALALFLFALRLGSAFTMSDVVYVYLKEFYGLAKSSTALILAFASGIGIAASIALNALADRVSERLATILIGVAASIGLILFSTTSVVLTCVGLVLLVASARSLTPLTRRIALTYARSEGIGYISAVGNVGVLVSSLALGAACDVLKAVPGDFFNSLASFTIPLAATIMLSSLILAYKLS